jgi:hypothetical protein
VPRSALAVGVAALLLMPTSVAAASPAVHRGDAHGQGTAQREAHAHAAEPRHVDPAPPGVKVTTKASTATIIDRSGVRHRPAKLKKVTRRVASGHTAGSRAAADTTVRSTTVVDVPAGTPGNPDLTQHVSPSCTGTGVDGNRVQALYAYEAGQPNRFTTVLPALQSYVADVDDTFALSSPAGNRRVRWVNTPSCTPDIRAVQLPVGSFDDNFGLDAIALAADQAGIVTVGRKLLTFADTAGLCGIGEIYQDDRSSSDNTNNTDIPMVARVDTQCWAMVQGYHSTPAHELMHMLGGVQESAPHSTTLGHCTDEYDVMCYEDGGLDHTGALAQMHDVCHATSSERLFDCGRDDYFNAGTPAAGSYLATHWNTARSSYLDVVSDGAVVEPVPTASVSGPSTLRPGLAATFTAKPSVPATVRWTASASGCLPTTVTTPSIRVQCPTSYHGTVRLTATFTAPDGQAFAATRSVSLTGAPAALSVALTASSKVYVGYASVLNTSVRYAGTPVRASLSVQAYTKLHGVWAWRTFATPTTTASGNARVYAPRWTTTGGRYYRVVVRVGSGSGWTHTVSPYRKTYTIWRTALSSSARSGRPDLVRGVLRTSTGAAVRSQYVYLQYRYSGSSTWHTLTRRVSSRTGYVAASVQPRRRTYYRWYYKGSTVYGAAVSAQRYLRY